MKPPIALQLYTVREAANQDYRKTVERVAQMGYVGVETAGFPGTTPKAARALFDDLGLKVCGAHLPMPLGEKAVEVLETIAALGNPPLVVPWQPPELFENAEGLAKLAALLNESQAVAKKNGFRLGYHNHHAEMHPMDGKPALLALSDMVDPEIIFEVDTYWAQTGGVDPAGLVRDLGARVSLLHVKDGPCVRGEPMLPIGDGVMDFPSIFEAGKSDVQWAIVELDACAMDMVAAVEKSYRYLVGQGLAYGNH
jgi:sugar phosphate isomerase/epimerase